MLIVYGIFGGGCAAISQGSVRPTLHRRVSVNTRPYPISRHIPDVPDRVPD